MTKRIYSSFFTIVMMGILSGLHMTAFAQQKDQVEGIWLNEPKDAKVQIYKATDNKYYGKIVWLKNPLRDGKPKLDRKNENEKNRSQPLVGLIILKGFNKEGNTYVGGTIYDPNNGKTYDCKITSKGDELNIRGYIGISLLGRTTVWYRSK